MKLGQYALHRSTSGCEFRGLQRARGIFFQHLAFDRAVFFRMSSRLEARVAAYYDEEVGMVLEHGRSILRNLDWSVKTACCMHGALSALKWRLLPWMSDGTPR